MKDESFVHITKQVIEAEELKDKIGPILEDYTVDVVFGSLSIIVRFAYDETANIDLKKAYLIEWTQWIHEESKKFKR